MTPPDYSTENSDLFTLEDEKVVVLGAGRSGIAAANLACARGAKVRLYDTHDVAFPDSLNKQVELICHATPEIGKAVHSDYLVISPGVDTYSPLVEAFQEHTTELLGELELASRYYSGTIVAITGTNGKTTTTEIITHLLNCARRHAISCGNHGIPLSELILTGAPEIAVIEVSSFQLETTSSFRPNVAVWMNFAADHLDRYPSLEHYREAKMRLFDGLHPTDWKISKEEEGLEFAYNHLTFSAWSETADYTAEGYEIHLPDGESISTESSQLRGKHNLENAMAAIAVLDCLEIDHEDSHTSLQSFTPPSHRCELIRTIDGVEYINDSKSTNLHSLETALNSFSQPLILIIGGKEKGLNYDSLIDLLAKNTKHVLTIGEIGDTLVKLISQKLTTPKVTYCETVTKAVLQAHQDAVSGDVVLFSPGTSSFDQFTGYIERGDSFRHATNSLS